MLLSDDLEVLYGGKVVGVSSRREGIFVFLQLIHLVVPQKAT